MRVVEHMLNITHFRGINVEGMSGKYVLEKMPTLLTQWFSGLPCQNVQHIITIITDNADILLHLPGVLELNYIVVVNML